MMTREAPTQPLIRIDGTATIMDAAHLMCDMSMGAMGVDDMKGDFLGLVTERDILWAVAQGKDGAGTPLMEIVNDFPIVVDGPLTTDAAARKMRQGHVRHLIVRQLGSLRIVSMRDLLVAYLDATGSEGAEHFASLTEMYRMFGSSFRPPVESEAS